MKRHLTWLVLLWLFSISSAPAQAQDPAAKAQAAIDKALNFLESQQQPDGGWQRVPQEPPGITALVLRAFVNDKRHTLKDDFVKKGYDKLLSYQKPDGGIFH